MAKSDVARVTTRPRQAPQVTLGRIDPIGAVEVAYEQVEAASDEAWLKQTLSAIQPWFAGLGSPLIATFRLTNAMSVESSELVGDGLMPEIEMRWRAGAAALSAQMARRCFLEGNAGTMSQLAARGDAAKQDYDLFLRVMSDVGFRDTFGVAACDAEKWGVNVSCMSRSVGRINERERVGLTRVAVHLTTAFRLRRRLRAFGSATTPDAVFLPDGRMLHAERSARSSEARELLKRAVAAIDRARGRLRREAPERALVEWKPLAAARWSLVDSFESDGRRFVLARQNACRVTGSKTLTDRERQIVAHVRLGQTSKVIAYTLGISDSTVRVLLARAYAKLGVRGRADLVALTKL